MSTGRLMTGWHPQLARAGRSVVGTASGRRWAAAARDKGSFAPRHGKAIEPAAWEEQKQQQQKTPPAAQPPVPDDKTSPEGAKDTEKKLKVKPEAEPAPAPEPEPKAPSAAKDASETAAPDADDAEQRARQARGEAAKPSRSLEAVLLTHVPAHAAKQHPHMSPPPYVHHFDSYSLVKQLQGGGYSQAQATTAMKAIRTLLAQNLDVAQQSLVSKSDVENETYLFTAACSELSTEIKNNRRLQDEHMRQQRTLLQHEVDILTQSLNQELLTLTDNVRGMFNDRKMAVREEQKAVDSAIQKINYKMSILLSSDCKSEIEGVRWILIRRSVLGIIFMAILTLGMLRYATYVGQQRQRDAERKQAKQEELRKDGGKTDHSLAADAAAILAAN